MVGPLNRVVVPYAEAKLYAIGQRNMFTMEELTYSGPLDEWCNIYLPKLYHLNTLNEAIEAAAKMSKDEEGFVVCDAQFNRIKVKSPEYLMAARRHNNGVITKKRLIEIVMTEKVDDFIAYCPQYADRLREVESSIKLLKTKLLYELVSCDLLNLFREERATFAKAISKNKFKHFLFGVYDKKYEVGTDYLKTLRAEQIQRLIESL
jgi:hypothetical protein